MPLVIGIWQDANLGLDYGWYGAKSTEPCLVSSNDMKQLLYDATASAEAVAVVAAADQGQHP